MDVDEVLCHGENEGATWETSHGGCIMRKVISKEATVRGRFDFFLDSRMHHGLTGELQMNSPTSRGRVNLLILLPR